MAEGDVYMIRATMTTTGQPDATNVFYYQQLGGGFGTALDLAGEFRVRVITSIAASQHTSVNWNQLLVVNGNNNADQVEQFISEDGEVTGTIMPSFIAMGYRSPRPGIGYQYGYKRFAGAPASLTSPGEFNTTQKGLMNNVGVALGVDLEGDLALYTPAIITGGFHLGVAPVVSYVADSPWSYNEQPTHQDTRQLYSWHGSS